MSQEVMASDVQGPDQCEHHWVIERPAGPVSKGVCRSCGAEREFQNYFEGSSWGYDASVDRMSGSSSRIAPGIDVSSAAKSSDGEDES